MSLFKKLLTMFGSPVVHKPLTEFERGAIAVTKYAREYRKKYGKPFIAPDSPATVTSSKPAIPLYLADTLPDWYCMSGIEPSAAEKLIIENLRCYPRVDWHREVCFKGFVTPKGGHYRFDFYLPKLGIIIEYNGQKYHESLDRMKVDSIKKEFCNKYGLKLVIFTKEHYYQLGTHIDSLLYSHNISIV